MAITKPNMPSKKAERK
jgi:hypothetical protein